MTSWETHFLTLDAKVQQELAARSGVYSIYKWLTALHKTDFFVLQDWNETAFERLFTANRLYGAGFDMMQTASMRMHIPMSLSDKECEKCKVWDDAHFDRVREDIAETKRRIKVQIEMDRERNHQNALRAA